MTRPFLCALFVLLLSNANAFRSTTAPTKPRIAKNLYAQSSSPIYYHNGVSDEVLADSQISLQQQQQQQNSNEAMAQVSMPLVRAIFLNQASILLFATTVVGGIALLFGGTDIASLHWSANSETYHSFFDVSMTPLRIVQGILATMPLVALGSAVEQSDDRDASNVNFSTTNMVISLFGRRKSSLDPEATSSALVMMLSLFIALSTGLSEELVFRGYTPVALASLTHSIPFALIGQAALFAFAHISPTSSVGENKVVGGFQFLNGLWYGMVYQLTGGDILPCVIAHMLYDMHVLCETWMTINRQMDYTHEAYQNNRLSETEELAIHRIQEQAGPALNRETLNFAKRFFYAFDSQHKGSLSLHDVQRAVSYAFLKDSKAPEPATVETTFHNLVQRRQVATTADRLSLSEFLSLLCTLKSDGSVVY